MKTVLLPTDLSIQSLWPIHKAVQESESPVHVHLVHLIDLPTSISDLLFLNEDKYYKAVPSNFYEAIQVFRNKYQGSIHQISFKFVYCNTSRYFRNMLEGNKVEAIYKVENYDYKLPFKESVALDKFLKNVPVPVNNVALRSEGFSQHLNLSVLLSGEHQHAAVPQLLPA